MADGTSNSLRVRLVTPERVLVDACADAVELPAANGYLEVLPGAAPLLAELGAGEVKLHGGDSHDARFFVAWGFVEVLPDQVTLLAESAQKPENISTADAEKEKAEGEKMWQEAGEDAQGYADANEMIAEAEAKLRSAGSH